MKNSKFKVYHYYHNINLWKFKSINKLNKKKWILLKNKSYRNIDGRIYSVGKYICHYKKLNITRLYYFKFINKQIFKKYFVNYKEYNLKRNFISNIYNLERRLDFNLYKTNFVTSLYEARFFITKGFIFVNKKCVRNFNYLLNTSDLVETHPFLYNLILKRKLISDINQYLYLRNLEIDYKTLSFVFLNQNDFFINNYNNFVKKIYFKQNNKNNNNYNNSYYKFFDQVFTDYLFLDKQHKIINENTKYINNHKVNTLLKFIKYKYNDYYFRNILLKFTFNLKYNYLQLLAKNNIFNNYNFENIDFIYKNLFNIDNNRINSSSLLLNTQFFNYYFILIFNYYNIILKNLNKINNKNLFFSSLYIYLLKNFSINNYSYLLLFNSKIFKLLNIKNKLNNYYINNLFIKNQINFNLNCINNNNIIKKINYKTISQYSNLKFHYNSTKVYNNLIYYISSYKFGYKIHKRSRNFQQNCLKRIKIIKKIQRSFYYTRFNCNRYGIYIKKYSKKTLYNQLKNNFFKNNIIFNDINKLQTKKITKQNSNKTIIVNKFNSPYYPKNSIIYKSIYNSLNITLKNNINIIRENMRKLNSLNNILKEFNNSNILMNYIYKLEKQLYFKLKFIQNNNKVDYNFNKNFKDIYFLYNLIEFFNKFNFNLNNKILLKTLNTNIVFKMHNKINLNYNNQLSKNKNKKYYIKKYKHLINDYKRCQLNFYYIPYNKSHTIISSNLKSYFLENIINNNSNKMFFTYYYCYTKLNLFNNYYINFYKKNKRNFLKQKYNKKFINIYKSLYLAKRENFKIDNKLLSSKIFNKNLINLNIIHNNNFNDKFFYIDLILNLTVRKFNTDYNKFNYYNYKTHLISLTTNNLINFKNNNKILSKKNKKVKNITKYNYKIYFIQNSIKIYNYNYLKYLNNKIIKYKSMLSNYQNRLYYNYNNTSYNIFLTNKLFRDYYGYYNSKYYKNNTNKIFIKFNKQAYINNMYKLYIYYTFNIKKYSLIKYIFKNYIFKEYTCFINKILTANNIKKTNNIYIKQLYYNLLFTKLFNFTQLDYTLKNNYNYSKNLRIIINYFIIINRLYK